MTNEKDAVSELFAFQANCADELADEGLRNTVTAVAATEPFAVVIYHGETAEAAQGVAQMFQMLADAAASCRSEYELNRLIDDVDQAGRRANERMTMALEAAESKASARKKMH